MSNIKSFNSFNEAKKERSGFEVPPPIPPPHLYKNKKIKKDVKKAKTLKGLKEHKETQNYMFFGNLETMKRLVDKMLEMDESEVDAILSNGHNWALDHIATSKDDVEEVFNFLAGRHGESSDNIVNSEENHLLGGPKSSHTVHDNHMRNVDIEEHQESIKSFKNFK
jgi:hypothetical protein